MSHVTDDVSDYLRQLRDELGGTWLVTITPSDPASADKLAWLARDDRDFLAVTPAMAELASEAFARAAAPLLEARMSVTPVVGAIGTAVLQHILERFRGGRRDITVRPDKPATVKRKGHGRVGIDSGALVESLADATVETRRA